MNFSPAERAAGLYHGVSCVRTFREDLEAHLLHGYVISTPEVFAMGRAVCRAAEAEAICDPWHVFPPEECDLWLVYLCAGDLREAMRHIPHPLPYIGWQRVRDGRRRLRVYRLGEFIRQSRYKAVINPKWDAPAHVPPSEAHFSRPRHYLKI